MSVKMIFLSFHEFFLIVSLRDNTFTNVFRGVIRVSFVLAPYIKSLYPTLLIRNRASP